MKPNKKQFGIAEIIFFSGVALTGTGIYLIFSLGYTLLFVGIVLILLGYYKSSPDKKG